MRVKLALVAILAFPASSFAQVEPTLPPAPAEPNQPVPPPSPPPTPEAVPGLWKRTNLLGSIGGLRTVLDGYGISFGLAEADEVFGNPTGGIKQGLDYQGLTTMSLSVDLSKAIGLTGGTFYVNAFQIHGQALEGALFAFNPPSSIEAAASTRLSELWYQQAFWGDKFDIRIGQLAADQEFMLTQFGAVFLNASFGWPTQPAIDLPAGGPAYPLSTPGVRLRVRPSDQLVMLLGVLNGSPAGVGQGNPQQLDASGTLFNLNSGVFVIGEVAYAAKFGHGDTSLAGTYKLGAWYNSNTFPDQYVLATGLGAVNGASHRSDWSVYAVVDQQVTGPVGVFLRAMGAPGDRNLIDVFLDGGITYKAPFGRDADTVGIGFGWAHVSGQAQLGQEVSYVRASVPGVVQTAETVIELTYQAQVAPWWQVQPDVQYIIRPGGGLPNPQNTSERIGNALVLGLRSIITF